MDKNESATNARISSIQKRSAKCAQFVTLCFLPCYAGDAMSDGPMMLTPILIISSRKVFS
jgi:hypothetical protein